MKRIHVNVTVSDLDRSIEFYSTLFASEPAVRHEDYAKWMLDDPRVNFAITNRGSNTGINHLGIQAEDDGEIADIQSRLENADAQVYDQGDVTCCYADSTKAWVRDPDGVAWETFYTREQVATYSDGGKGEAARIHGGKQLECCGARPGPGKGIGEACC